MTLLMVTHEMQFARKVADRVLFMQAGRIHEEGPPQELFEPPAHPSCSSSCRRWPDARRPGRCLVPWG